MNESGLADYLRHTLHSPGSADEVEALIADRDRLAERVETLTPPTAGQIVAHLDAGGTVERWHPWKDGGGWGCPHSADEYAWRTCPPDEPQPGFRLRALVSPDTPTSPTDPVTHRHGYVHDQIVAVWGQGVTAEELGIDTISPTDTGDTP
jgi:hypothetical protein